MNIRTTFFVLRAGPYVKVSDASEALPNRAEFERPVFKVGHRRGHWSREALERLAARHGMELVEAYSIARDSKGWFETSRRDIVR